MSAATDALSEGLTELLTELGKAFTYGGTSFQAVTDNTDGGDDLGRGYSIGKQFDTTLMVDPSVSAFTSGLPSKGAKLIRTSDSRIFTVDSVSYGDSDHVAYLHCRKLTA